MNYSDIDKMGGKKKKKTGACCFDRLNINKT